MKIQAFYYLPNFCGFTGLSLAARPWVSPAAAVTWGLCVHRVTSCACLASHLGWGISWGLASISPRCPSDLCHSTVASDYFSHGFPWLNTLRSPSRRCKAFQDLALEVPECHFHSILLVKRVMKASPDSDRSSPYCSAILSQIIATLPPEDESGCSPQGRLAEIRDTEACRKVVFFMRLKLPTQVILHPPPPSDGWGQEELAPAV